MLEQLRRSLISVEANIVEGYALRTAAHSRNHYRITFGSAAESDILLQDCLELGYLPADLVSKAQPTLDRCMRTLRGLMKS